MIWTIKARLAKAHKSLTIWFNGVMSAISSALLALPVEQVLAYMPQMRPYLADENFRTAMSILLVVNLINMLLRFKTTKALEAK